MTPQLIVTVDVEDYFMSPEAIAVSDWETYPDRLPIGLHCLWDTLASTGSHRATFFWLGWLADRYPDLVRECAARGHEIAIHGWDHRPVWMLGPQAFRSSLLRTRSLLQDLSGQPVTGHRAPEYSLRRRCGWMWHTLAHAGIRYDSSLLPVQTYLFGDATVDPRPHRISAGDTSIIEWPVATVPTGYWRWPVACGAFFRLAPIHWTRRMLRRWHWLSRRWPPHLRWAVINLHPWEFDPNHPQLDLPWFQQLIHRIGLHGHARRLHALLTGARTCTLNVACSAFDGTTDNCQEGTFHPHSNLPSA